MLFFERLNGRHSACWAPMTPSIVDDWLYLSDEGISQFVLGKEPAAWMSDNSLNKKLY